MKAITYLEYGSPDVLRYEEIGMPTPGDGDVLLRVRAAAANPLDWHFMRGEPYAVRIVAGLSKPKVTQLGVDVSGEVEAVGRNVTRFKPGDVVFGSCQGAFAEYVRAPESALVAKPDNVTFEEAAAVPVAAFTALQALRDKGRLQPGQKLLINGAAGGVGTFAVQIAKSLGAQVTGVCSTRNVDLVRSIGADHVVDYTQADFTQSSERYDLILDLVGNHSLAEFGRVLNPKGIYVGAGGTSDRWMVGPLLQMLRGFWMSLFGSRKFVGILAQMNQADLTILRGLLESGKVTSVIDRTYGLADVPAAIRYLEEGHARGKVVITIGQDGKA